MAVAAHNRKPSCQSQDAWQRNFKCCGLRQGWNDGVACVDERILLPDARTAQASIGPAMWKKNYIIVTTITDDR